MINLFRSSEEALDILLKFKHIKTREAIQKQLMRKFDPILEQFTKEVATVERIFSVSNISKYKLRKYLTATALLLDFKSLNVSHLIVAFILKNKI